MSDLKKKLNSIMLDIEKNIKNKEDLEYVKSQIYSISLLFLDEMDKLAEINLKKLNLLMDKEKQLAKKVASVEKTMDHIQKEMYISQDYDFEIVCPYCNEEFVEDFSDGIKSDVRCPECDNIIELDWHEDDSCNCGCENDHCDCNEDCNCDDDCECDDDCDCGCDGHCDCDNDEEEHFDDDM